MNKLVNNLIKKLLRNYGVIPSKLGRFVVNYYFKKNDDQTCAKMILNTQNAYLIKFINNEEIKVECYFKLKNNLNKFDYYEFREFLLALKNEEIKLKYLKYIPDYWQKEVINNINDNKLLMKYYGMDGLSNVDILCKISDDDFKIAKINDFSIVEQVSIISSFSKGCLVKKFLDKPQFHNYQSLIMSSIKKAQVIKDCFNETELFKSKIEIIDAIKDDKLKQELIISLNNKLINQVYMTNSKFYAKEICSSVSVDNIRFDIDSTITIGVELEVCGENSTIILLLKNILSNWEIKYDESLYNGMEISSPILSFNSKDMKKLKYICSFLQEYNFHTNELCGGHIHLGFKYFKTVDEYKTFLTIYANVENLIYIISNRSGSIIRNSINKYFKQFAKNIGKLSLQVNWNNIRSLDSCVEIVKSAQNSIRYGLNTLNINSRCKNTIEFRMPNGEIQFEELVYNIKLFAKLFELSRKVSDGKNKELVQKYNYLTNIEMNDDEKLILFLDMMFDYDDEKRVYRERYNMNKQNNTKVKRLSYPIRLK